MTVTGPLAPNINQAHQAAMRTPLKQVARVLAEVLSRRLTAYLVGVKDAKTVTRWANGEVTNIRQENLERLRTAYEIHELLVQFDSPETVRAWFVGLNPQLGDVSPAEAIRQGSLQEALNAARAFVAGG